MYFNKMQYSVAAALLCCEAAQALSDSFPFVLFSTSKLPSTSSTAQLQTSKQVLITVEKALESCPTEHYLLVSQPNVHASDLRDATGTCQIPQLGRAIAAEKTQGLFSVAEVVGTLGTSTLKSRIESSCTSRGKKHRVETVEMQHLPSLRNTENRTDMLAGSDHELGLLLESMPEDYTVLFYSDPNDAKPYEAEFVESFPMDLKRRAEHVVGASSKNSTDHAPLFEKYQFFTSGIFMSLIILFILLSILGVGLKALSSLEVSYGAFDKEIGPSAQRKQG